MVLAPLWEVGSGRGWEMGSERLWEKEWAPMSARGSQKL